MQGSVHAEECTDFQKSDDVINISKRGRPIYQCLTRTGAFEIDITI